MRAKEQHRTVERKLTVEETAGSRLAVLLLGRLGKIGPQDWSQRAGNPLASV